MNGLQKNTEPGSNFNFIKFEQNLSKYLFSKCLSSISLIFLGIIVSVTRFNSEKETSLDLVFSAILYFGSIWIISYAISEFLIYYSRYISTKQLVIYGPVVGSCLNYIKEKMKESGKPEEEVTKELNSFANTFMEATEYYLIQQKGEQK